MFLPQDIQTKTFGYIVDCNDQDMNDTTKAKQILQFGYKNHENLKEKNENTKKDLQKIQ